MRADLGAEAVLQRRDDAPAVGVVLRVRARDEQQVERQPQRVAAHLDVALLEHVEQRHLDPLGEVGQLVDRRRCRGWCAGRARSARSRGRRACGPRATLTGSTSPIRSPTLVSGRGELLAVPLAAVLPARPAARRRARRAAAGSARTPGAYGWSLISQPSTTGRPLVEQRRPGCGSAGSCPGRARRAARGRGRRAARAPAPAARSSSKPTMPGKRRRPVRIAASRFSRISVLTGRCTCPEARSAPSVRAAGEGLVLVVPLGMTSTVRLQAARSQVAGTLAAMSVPTTSDAALPVTLDDVRRRASCCAGSSATPRCRARGRCRKRVGGPVWLKCENLQRAGSFKIRGAYTRLSPARAGRARARRRRGQRRQPRAGRGARRLAARHHGHGVHARGRADPQGRGDPRLRRRRALPRALGRRGAGRGPGVRRRDRRGPHPPVRPPRHRRRAGHGRPGDPRAGARRATVVVVHRRWRSARRHRGGGQGAAARRARRRRAGRGRRGLPGVAGGRPPGRRSTRWRRWPTASRSAARATVPFEIVRDLVDDVVTVSEESLSRALLLCLERAKLVVEPAGAAGGGGGARRPDRRSSRRSWSCCPAATSTRCCCMRVLRHGLAVAGPLPVVPGAHPRPAGRAGRGCSPRWPQADANVLEVEHVRTDARLRVDEVEVALQLETRGAEHCDARAGPAARGRLPARLRLAVLPERPMSFVGR